MKPIFRRVFFAIQFFIVTVSSFAQNLEFVENKGQWPGQVQFSTNTATGAFYIESTGFKNLLNNPTDRERIIEYFTGHSENAVAAMQPYALADNFILRSHAYAVRFVGASASVKPASMPLSNTYNNYFIGNDRSKWASGCRLFQEIVYKEIYPGIDIRYHTGNGHIKYDFIVHAGADAGQILMEVAGADHLEIINGNLVIKTSVGDVEEQQPYTYQQNGTSRITVNSDFELSGNTVRFKLATYDKSKDLVIDPELVFSSFIGSGSDNWGYGATNDSQGNLYAGGIVFGNLYPVTVGAFQTTWAGGGNTGENGGFDIGITKFNANGTQRLYATYLGGSTGNDCPSVMLVDAQDNLILVGRTTASNYPSTQTNIGVGGGWDIVVTKLSANGSSLIGSRRIGGSSDDGVNIKHKYALPVGPLSLQRNYGEDSRAEITLDAAGNIYIAECTQSSNFPVTGSVFQGVKSGLQDALIMKFDPTVSNLLFASFLGGSGDDAAYSLSLDPNGDIIAGGGTTSTDFPGNKTGTVGTSYAGGLIDGFLARISSDGSQLKKTTYIGTSATEQIQCLQVDASGDIYAIGAGTGNFPVYNATFSQAGGKQFIIKIKPGFDAFYYSTVFGPNTTSQNIVPTAFLVDPCGNVYVSGWGGTVVETSPPYANSGTTGLTVTANAIQATTDGRDFYMFVLAKDATSQLYGSFFGQIAPARIADHMDGGKNRFSPDGTLYLGICANCQGGAFPVTPGVVGPTNPSGRCNQVGVKVQINLAVCALPLKWLNFAGVYANNVAQLSWQTAQEENTLHFEVERSIDGIQFSKAGQVAASNTTGATYHFKDAVALQGTMFYRLKQVDKDGHYSYSSTIKLNATAGNGKIMHVSPNPAKDKLTISYTQLAKTSKLLIINSAGTVVKEKLIVKGSNSVTIDIHDLAAAVYIISIEGEKAAEKTKFLKL